MFYICVLRKVCKYSNGIESFIPSPFVNSWMIPCIWPTKYPQVILMGWGIACWKSITIKAMLVTSQLCCVGYIICMWLHQHGFFGEMESSKSAVSDQYKWYRDHIIVILKIFDIFSSELEKLARDQASWWHVCMDTVQTIYWSSSICIILPQLPSKLFKFCLDC